MNKKFINVLLIFAISIIAVSLLTTVKAADLKPYKLGDVDGNGVITKHDANLVLTMIANNKKGEFKVNKDSMAQVAADFNKDGKLTALDAKRILQNVESNLGDVNGDGRITVVDAKLILKVIAFPDKYDKKSADVNGDGKVSVLDNKILMKKIANMHFADIDGDGKIGVSDVNAIKGYVDGNKVLTPLQLFNADINNDGDITEKDVALYLNYIAKR